MKTISEKSERLIFDFLSDDEAQRELKNDSLKLTASILTTDDIIRLKDAKTLIAIYLFKVLNSNASDSVEKQVNFTFFGNLSVSECNENTREFIKYFPYLSSRLDGVPEKVKDTWVSFLNSDLLVNCFSHINPSDVFTKEINALMKWIDAVMENRLLAENGSQYDNKVTMSTTNKLLKSVFTLYTLIGFNLINKLDRSRRNKEQEQAIKDQLAVWSDIQWGFYIKLLDFFSRRTHKDLNNDLRLSFVSLSSIGLFAPFTNVNLINYRIEMGSAYTEIKQQSVFGLYFEHEKYLNDLTVQQTVLNSDIEWLKKIFFDKGLLEQKQIRYAEVNI